MGKVIISYERNSRIVEYSSEVNLENDKRKFANDLALIRGRTRLYAENVIYPALKTEQFVPTYRLYCGKNANKSDEIVIQSF